MKRKILPILIILLLTTTVFAQTLVQPDTIRICAIRVEFSEDDNELTTGNGKFMIDTVTTDPYAIDPTPHNRLYFKDQILAAANYFEKVSNGKIIIRGDAFPLADNGAYQLENPMGFYNPNTTDEEINLGISQLFNDAINVADEDENILFNTYDLVVVFHAGVGRDIALDFDPTPQDISSLFITHEFLKESFGTGFQGVPADNGFVTQGVLLPETENQEGEKIALTGIFVSNIGSYLGLYDLFSPSKQRSGIGRFGLMDVGLLNMNGLVPSPPGAFSRKILGWSEPVKITQPQSNISVGRLGSKNTTEADLIEIPINDDEYYLIEYRGDSNVNIDSLFFDLLEGRSEVPSYLEVLVKNFSDQIEIGESGVLLAVPDYDWGLPGSGILIWHVDERIIAEKGPLNRINDDPLYRAVDIEEADGSQDIGKIYSILEAGYQTELGTLADFWYSNRPEYLEGFELYENEFSTKTAPNSRANLNNTISHITLNNFSNNKSEKMTFDYLRDIYEIGFPVKLSEEDIGIRSVLSGSIENFNDDFLFIADASGDIYAVGDSLDNIIGLLNSDNFKFAEFGDVGEIFTIGLANSNAQSANDLLIAASGKKVAGYSLTNTMLTPGQYASAIFRTDLRQEIIGPVVTVSDNIYIPSAGKTIYVLNLAGVIEDSIQTTVDVEDIVVRDDGTLPDFLEKIKYAAIAPLQENNQFNLITYETSLNSFYIFDDQGDQIFNFEVPVKLKGQFALADLDGNSTLDIVYNASDGIYAYNQKGYPITGFPIKPSFSISDSLVGTPLILDINNDDLLDLVVVSSKGQVMVYSSEGQPLADYQLSTGGKIQTSPVVMQFDEDSGLELLTVTESGSVYAWQLDTPIDAQSNYWLQSNYNSSNNVLIKIFTAYKPISKSLMPENRVYNYPNPNEGDLTKIRYYLNETAKVKVRIFDTAGTLVDEFSGPGEGEVDNEIPWNVSSIASGIYLCKIEAKSNTRSESKLIKIMVVH